MQKPDMSNGFDTSSKAVRRAHRDWWIQKQTELNDTFTKSNVDSVSVRTNQDYVKGIVEIHLPNETNEIKDE